MADEVIKCVDCRSDFTFTESESTFFASKGLTKPRRCKTCRQKRRDARSSSSATVEAPAPQVTRKPQWVGGGEEDSQRNRRKDRRKDRRGDDSSY